jgi:PIN domain nuclease of toxin-antitoxin system
MNVLLDTHTFIWLDSAPEKLSKSALECCQNENNTLYLSTVSVWETQIKNQLGKLNFKIPIAEMIAIQQQDNDLKILDINLQHIYQLKILPLHHNDPFDRLLLSQSTIENMPLISADEKFKYYDNAKIIW